MTRIRNFFAQMRRDIAEDISTTEEVLFVATRIAQAIMVIGLVLLSLGATMLGWGLIILGLFILAVIYFAIPFGVVWGRIG